MTIVLSAVTALTSGCSVQRQTKIPPNIILVVVDTLRADRLGAYGNRDDLTPFIDSLSDRGYVFQEAYASSSWTYPSVASIFTARFPGQHRVVQMESVLSDSETTLAEVLSRDRYDTFGFQANVLLAEAKGFAQGLGQYRSYPLAREKVEGDESRLISFHARAETLNRDALERVRKNLSGSQGKKPFFLYMQYMEPHSPWRPTEGSLAQTLTSNVASELLRLNDAFFLARLYQPTQQTWSEIRGLYDASVRDLDNELRRFFEELERMGALENTYIIFTADHGEELGEHEGLALHGISLFNEETHVPLIVVPPWRRQRLNVLDVVSLVDLAPTIVKLAGLTPPPTFVGRSLDAYLQRQPALNSVSASRGAFSSLVQLRRGKNEVTPLQRILHRSAYVHGAKKLLESSGGVLQMYGIDDDHLEFDLRTVGRDDQAMKRAYELAVKVAGANATKAEVAPIDQAMLEQLKALGYSD